MPANLQEKTRILMIETVQHSHKSNIIITIKNLRSANLDKFLSAYRSDEDVLENVSAKGKGHDL